MRIAFHFAKEMWPITEKFTTIRFRGGFFVYFVKLGLYFKFQRFWIDLRRSALMTFRYILGVHIHQPTAICVYKVAAILFCLYI